MTSSQTTRKRIRIGGATGYWGDADMALPQFLADEQIDYVVFDYLAEITMSILARARAQDDRLGYATDFITDVIDPHIGTIADRGIKLISNAGGVNPEACAAAIRRRISELGLDLSVAVVVGDDITAQLSSVVPADTAEMFSGERLPPLEKVASANAYLGAFPIAMALDQGADIVITGRCVDSAVTLGACIHSFGWSAEDLDLLAAGSLAGHLIECGPQATGGNHTDWEKVADTLHNVGYPIAEVDHDGGIVITKPRGTGGAVTVGTVAEQLLYEIGNPAAYDLPDVSCDFSQVTMRQLESNSVSVTGARGNGVPDSYKVSITWSDGWRGGAQFYYAGPAAAHKARIFAHEGLTRARKKLTALGAADYADVSIEVIGDHSHYGPEVQSNDSREVALKVASRHDDKRAVALLMKELTGAALAAPPGLFMFAGTRPKPSPVIRLFSCLVPKDKVDVTVSTESGAWPWLPSSESRRPDVANSPVVPEPAGEGRTVTVPLHKLAWLRSGDKGDKANIGVIARRSEYLPWIAAALSVDTVAARFAHFMTGPNIDRFYMPGLPALNFVIHNVLGGGGVASLRSDPQGKCYSQLLLESPVLIPASLLGD